MNFALPLLQAFNLSLRYGSNIAVKDVTINVDEGEFVALIGANGAGKSSLLKAIVGLEPVFAGRVVFADAEITSIAAHRRVKRGIAFVPEGRGVFREMSVAENLELGSFLRSNSKFRSMVAADLDRVFELFPRLAERSSQIAGTLSGGEQQMLSIGRALMTSPRMLVLDEPSLGLAPRVVEEIALALKQLNSERGLSILVAEQNAVLGLSMAKRGYVLNSGRIALQGDATVLAQKSELIDTYLGSSINNNERKIA